MDLLLKKTSLVPRPHSPKELLFFMRKMTQSLPSERKASGTHHKNRETILETYIKAVSDSTEGDLRKQRRNRDNLSNNERKALKDLQKRMDIDIKPADKGSATVVMSHEDYVAEAMRQLNNPQHYQHLQDDPSQEFSTEITTFLKGMKENRATDQKSFEYLTPTHVRPAHFYLVPKIQKLGNPGRPIVSSCGAPTEISHFVDYHLRPHVQLPSYLKDTIDFLRKLSNMPELPPGTLLVTLDVISLYTNIPHEDRITVCEELLQTRTLQEPPTADLVQLIRFMFSDQHFLTIHGTAMGTRMAPSYTNIFMGVWSSIS